MQLVDRQFATIDSHETTLQLLIHTLISQKATGKGATFIIGAGCSLSSSPTDISTAGIIRSIVEEIQGKFLPQSVNGFDVYRSFVNLWSRLGDKQVIRLLEHRLSGLTPSSGYRHLRTLAAKGFIGHLITTNFDLLIDEVLGGLSYKIIYGSGDSVQLGDPPSLLTVIKVHGDLRKGRPLFTPFEIVNLPGSIVAAVEEASRAPTIVCGYRGQDLGLMKALDHTPSFNAFWINPEMPDWADSYTYSWVRQWLHSRRSEENCLSGPKYGRFDELLPFIVNALETPFFATHPAFSTALPLPEPWASSLFGQMLGTSVKLQVIFNAILSAITATTARFEWLPRPPHYSDTYEIHLQALLEPLKADYVPLALRELLDNEFDVLFVGTALALMAQAAGVDIPMRDLLHLVADKYAESSPRYQPDESFWSLLSVLLGQDELKSAPREIRLSLNSRNRLNLVVTPAPMEKLQELLSFIGALALTFPSAKTVDSPPQSLRIRLLMQENIVSVEEQAGRSLLLLRDLSPADFSRIATLLTSFFPDLKAQTGREDRLTFRWLEVQAEFTTQVLSPASTIGTDLFTTLLQTSESSLRRFHHILSAFDTLADKALPLRSEARIERFLESRSTGIFVIGPSGSGKTTALRNLFALGTSGPLLPVVVMQAHRNSSAKGLRVFLPKLVEGDRPDQLESEISAIAEVLSIRDCKMVLVLDGLNENMTSSEALSLDYRDILDLTGMLASNGKDRIKLLVTCREATFLNLLRSDGFPSATSFSWGEDAGGLPQPYYAVPELDPDERKNLIGLYFDPALALPFENFLSANRLLERDFARPYILAVAGATIKTLRELDGLKSVNQIFARFTGQMLSRLGDESALVIAEKIIQNFFSIHFSGTSGPLPVQRLKLLSNFTRNETRLASDTLRLMEDVNILRPQAACSGHIEFSHDRITEYFMGEFLLRESTNPSFFHSAAQWAPSQSTFDGGVREYFSRVWVYVEQQHSSAGWLLDALIRNVSNSLPQAAEPLSLNLVKSLLSCKDSPIVTRCLFQATRRLASAGDAEHLPTLLMRCAIRGSEELARADWASEVLPFSNVLEAIWLDLRLGEGFVAEILLVQAISLAKGGDLSGGLQRIERALRKAVGREDTYLRDKIATQKAVLIRESGNKLKAKRLLRSIYANQVLFAAWEPAARTALDLGMALRDDTKFREALKLYEKVTASGEGLPEILRARLSLQMGIIFKNLAQREIKGAQLGRESGGGQRTRIPERLLSDALSHNMEALDWAESHNSLGILIEALTERSECLLIAARLDNSRSLPQAELFLDRLESLLRYFPAAARLVDFQRLRANSRALRGELLSALEHLERGRLLALDYGLLFKACDCDYQIGFQVLFTVRQIPHLYYLQKGIDALQRAIDFYRRNVSPTNEYLNNVTGWREQLQAAGKELGLLAG